MRAGGDNQGGEGLAEEYPGDDRTKNRSEAQQERAEARPHGDQRLEKEGVAERQTDDPGKTQPNPARPLC